MNKTIVFLISLNTLTKSDKIHIILTILKKAKRVNMRTFGQKVKDARSELGLTQAELAEITGVSMRSVISYEKDEKLPRQNTLLNLSRALRVSSKFLTDETCDDPLKDIERDGYIKQARKEQGMMDGHDIEEIIHETAALFSGRDLTQEQKDRFFYAVMTAYVLSKEKAVKKCSKMK